MGEGKARSLPRFESLLELVEFVDTHDMGEYWDQMPEAHFEVAIKRRTHLIAIDEAIADKLTQIAKTRGTTSGALINSWLREKIRKAS